MPNNPRLFDVEVWSQADTASRAPAAEYDSMTNSVSGLSAFTHSLSFTSYTVASADATGYFGDPGRDIALNATHTGALAPVRILSQKIGTGANPSTTLRTVTITNTAVRPYDADISSVFGAASGSVTVPLSTGTGSFKIDGDHLPQVVGLILQDKTAYGLDLGPTGTVLSVMPSGHNFLGDTERRLRLGDYI